MCNVRWPYQCRRIARPRNCMRATPLSRFRNGAGHRLTGAFGYDQNVKTEWTQRVFAQTDRLHLIRSSWALAAADPDRTSQTFYSNLFRLDPTTKPLFVGDLQLQGEKLMQTLGFVVDHLEDPDVLMPAAVDLAQRHIGYGVNAKQYASVGAALIQTLEQLLGPKFTQNHRDAWTQTYGGLSKAMTDAAYPDLAH